MKVYVDESGNTGETLPKGELFNFREQPIYVLAGFVANSEKEAELLDKVDQLATNHRIEGSELKSKSLYPKKSRFVIELLEYMIDEEIPIFIEIMDKQFYMNMQLLEHFIAPTRELEVTEAVLERKRLAAAHLSEILEFEVYESFARAVKGYSSESLERFFEELLDYCNKKGLSEFALNINRSKENYDEWNTENPEDAFKDFLPLPDQDKNGKLIHLLPNVNAFSNMVGRVQKYSDDSGSSENINIIHDEQREFELVFSSVLDAMKALIVDKSISDSVLAEKIAMQYSDSTTLIFVDSKENKMVQIADLIAGVTMRFWMDFLKGNEDQLQKYLPTFRRLNSMEYRGNPSINYVLAAYQYIKIHERFRFG